MNKKKLKLFSVCLLMTILLTGCFGLTDSPVDNKENTESGSIEGFVYYDQNANDYLVSGYEQTESFMIPQANVKISIEGVSQVASTNQDGYFRIDGLKSSTYNINIAVSNEQVITRQVTVYNDRTTKVGSRSVAEKEWTILLYANAKSSDLTPAINRIVDDINYINNRNVNIVVLTGIDSSGSNNYSHYNVIKYASDTSGFRKVKEYGDINMGTEAVLRDFVGWAHEEYPASKKALFIVGHSNGWFISKPQQNYIAYDESNEVGLETYEIGNALSGYNIDLLYLVACNSGTIETIMDMTTARYILASASVGYLSSGNLTHILQLIEENPTLTPRQYGEEIVQSYIQGFQGTPTTIALYDTDYINQFNTAMSEFADNINSLSYNEFKDLSNAWYDYNQTYPIYSNVYYHDLYDVLDNAIKRNINWELTNSAENVKNVFSNLVLKSDYVPGTDDLEGVNYEGSQGLSIYLPSDLNWWSLYDYEHTDFANSTGWDNVADKYYDLFR
ncbi:MAG: clostripain-related cysteine peptidase [bacterium]